MARVVRIIGGLGKTIIAIGIVILLFGMFQLWGTGLIEARNQDSLSNDFDNLLNESEALRPATPPVAAFPAATGSNATNNSSQDSANPTATGLQTNTQIQNPETTQQTQPAAQTNGVYADSDTQVAEVSNTPSNEQAQPAAAQPATVPIVDEEWARLLYRNPGEAIARIEIPSLDVKKTVVAGVRSGDLRKGPGHYPATPLPGQAGNAAIAGHRTTYGAPFGQIDKLKPGDEIVITTVQGQFTYQVVPQGAGHGHFIVPPSAVEVLNQNFSVHPNRLTLTACHPRGSARQRIIVVAELLGPPAPTFVRPGQQTSSPPQLASEALPDEPLTNEQLTDEQQNGSAAGGNAANSASTNANITGNANANGVQDSLQTVTSSPDAALGTAQTPGESPQAGSGTSDNADNADAVAAGGSTSGGNNTSGQSSGSNSASDSTGTGTAGVRGISSSMSVSSFGEGLDGDSGAVGPAVVWGIALLAMWMTALFAGHRYKRLPAYAVAALPLAVVMFMAFWHIDQALPSY
ncbi:MAG: class E sortase [bacterium]|nr:class E sortase [bacterium]